MSSQPAMSLLVVAVPLSLLDLDLASSSSSGLSNSPFSFPSMLPDPALLVEVTSLGGASSASFVEAGFGFSAGGDSLGLVSPLDFAGAGAVLFFSGGGAGFSAGALLVLDLDVT